MAERDTSSEMQALERSLSGIEAVLDLKSLETQLKVLEEKAGSPDL